MAKPNNDVIAQFHDYGIYVPTRTLYMGSENVATESDFAESGCDAIMAERMIKNLHVLESLSKEPITIFCNNVGGDEYHCFAIYDSIKACKSHVTIKVRGHAMSAGSIILQAADERIISPSSRQMIHYGTWGVTDHSKTYQKWAEEGRKIDSWMENMYLERIKAKHPMFKLSKIQKMLDHDTFFNAQESVSIGLADKVED
jgi:ATP-dependent Clp protease protease subunit